MSTRLQRPSIWRQIAVTAVLLAFQGYLGYNAIGGQFGFESQKQMHADIEELQAQSGSLQAEIDAYRHRVESVRTRQARSGHPDRAGAGAAFDGSGG